MSSTFRAVLGLLMLSLAGSALAAMPATNGFVERPRAPGTQTITVNPVSTRQVRLVIDHDGKGRAGITELMLWRR